MAAGKDAVLYIADLWQFLPDDARRKGRSTPLEWGKLRSPADDSEGGVRHQLRLHAIKALRDGFAIAGIYYELLAHFGFARSAALRGWLVNHDYRAATIPQIGQVIGCADAAFLSRAIKALLAAGLLVRAQHPDFEAAIAKDRTIRGDKAAAPAKPRRSRKVSGGRPAGGRTPAGKRPARGRPAAVPRPDGGRTPVNSETGDVQTRDVQTRDLQTATTAAASAAPSPQPLSAHGNGETLGDSETASARPPPDPESGETSRPSTPHEPPETEQAGNVETAATTGPAASPDAQPPASPTTTPPSAGAGEPTQADPARGEAENMGARHAVAAVEAMVDEIMAALYPTREDLWSEGRKAEPPQPADRFEARERGALASGIGRAMRRLGQVGRVQLVEAGIAMAERVRRRRTRRPRGAVWLYWLGKHAGAGPKDAVPP